MKAKEWVDRLAHCSTAEQVADFIDNYIEETITLANARHNAESSVREQIQKWQKIVNLSPGIDKDLFLDSLHASAPDLYLSYLHKTQKILRKKLDGNIRIIYKREVAAANTTESDAAAARCLRKITAYVNKKEVAASTLHNNTRD